MTAIESTDVLVVGGVSGLSAGLFTARHDGETVVVDAGNSILCRNAHLENFPGFPAGVNPRQFLDLLAEQAGDAGCSRVRGRVTQIHRIDGGFHVETAAGDGYRTEYVIVATKGDVALLDDIDGVGIPPADRDHIFEPGFSTSDGGSGLGMVITKAIVEAHGWPINLSESESGGVRFDVMTTQE